MIRPWVTAVLLAGGWIFLFGFYIPNIVVGYLLLGCAVGLASLSWDGPRVRMRHRDAVLFSLVLITAGLTFPHPYNTGPVLLLCGVVLCFLSDNLHCISALPAPLLFCGLITTANGALTALYQMAVVRFRNTPLPAWAISHCAELLGLDIATGHSCLFLDSAAGMTEFTVNAESTAILPWLVFLLAMTATMLLLRPRHPLRFMPFLFVSQAAYLLLRYLALCLLYVDSASFPIFWKSEFVFLSFVPMAAIYPVLFSPEQLLAPYKRRTIEILLPARCGIIGALVLSFSILLFACFYAGGADIKTGRIMIDEKHSNWEWTTKAFDTTWYGKKSGYNYYCLYDYLAHFYEMSRNTKQLTPQRLSKTSVLIIKTPTTSFSESEKVAVVDFVRKGGGLFLIGDHTNVYGTGTYLNPLAEEFGLRFRFDATYDLLSGQLQLYKPAGPFLHPVVQYMPPFLYGTSCTLEGPLRMKAVMAGKHLRSVNLDYSEKGFFSRKTNTPDVDFGTFLQCAAVRFGKGRVLAFTDSTVFSNFWIFLPGKPELLLGAISWLNRRARPWLLYLLAVSAACILLLWAVCRLRAQPLSTGLLVLFVSALTALAACGLIIPSLNRLAYPAPQPHTSYVEVAFETAHCNIVLPARELVAGKRNAFHTFYVWMQRLGYVPRVRPSLGNAVDSGTIVVLANPAKPFSEREIHTIQQYVRNGGKLVVLDSYQNPSSTAPAVLGPFGISMEESSLQGQTLYDTEGNYVVTTTTAAMATNGGDPVLQTKEGESVIVRKPWGKGMVVAISDSRLFSDQLMGTTATVPNEQQLRIYQQQFAVFGSLAEPDALNR